MSKRLKYLQYQPAGYIYVSKVDIGCMGEVAHMSSPHSRLSCDTHYERMGYRRREMMREDQGTSDSADSR
jgi:hypothetical protein